MRDLTLGIETSCDDTSVALVDAEGVVHFSQTANQNSGHLPFGGVVPELASRLHAEALLPLIDQAISSVDGGWSQIRLISTTSRPGLIGSLLVGVVTAKTLAQAFEKPLIGVNHIHGHIFSVFLKDPQDAKASNISFPYICLVVSGGHTHLYHVQGFDDVTLLGKTRDDAAGEAFDKFANLLELGFPGGPLVDQKSKDGNSKAFSFPRSMMGEDHLEFSFSGLKSAAARTIADLKSKGDLNEQVKADLCASYQEAICEVLISKLGAAQKRFGVKDVAISGGVSANSRLREMAEIWCRKENLKLKIPPLKYCTDNAAMIAYAGQSQFALGVSSNQELTPSSQAMSGDFHESHRA